MWPSVSGPENTRGATGLGRGKVAVRELFARTLRLRPDHLLVCQAKRASKKAPKTAKGTQEEPLVCTRMPVWGVRNCAGCARPPGESRRFRRTEFAAARRSRARRPATGFLRCRQKSGRCRRLRAKIQKVPRDRLKQTWP